MRLPDTTLLRISLIISLIGLTGIGTIFFTAQAPLATIQEAKALPDHEPVRVQGTITSFTSKNGLSIMTIENTCTITATTSGQALVAEGMEIEATGTLGTYKGERELQLDELTIR